MSDEELLKEYSGAYVAAKVSWPFDAGKHLAGLRAVEAATIEACAQECDALASVEGIAQKCAKAIRAMGGTTG